MRMPVAEEVFNCPSLSAASAYSLTLRYPDSRDGGCTLAQEHGIDDSKAICGFPGGPVAKTPYSQHRGPGLNPWSGD